MAVRSESPYGFQPLVMLVSDDGRVLGTRNGTNITVDGETLPSAFYVAVVSANGRGGNLVFHRRPMPHALIATRRESQCLSLTAHRHPYQAA